MGPLTGGASVATDRAISRSDECCRKRSACFWEQVRQSSWQLRIAGRGYCRNKAPKCERRQNGALENFQHTLKRENWINDGGLGTEREHFTGYTCKFSHICVCDFILVSFKGECLQGTNLHSIIENITIPDTNVVVVARCHPMGSSFD